MSVRRRFEKVWGGPKEGKGSEIQEDVLSKQTPRISFEIVKINRRGARQKRELVFSDDGISNMKGKQRQWFFHITDLFGIEPGRPITKDAKPVLNLKVIKRYQFECESDDQLDKIAKVFYQLYSDRLPINNASQYNGYGAYIGDYVNSQQITPSSVNSSSTTALSTSTNNHLVMTIPSSTGTTTTTATTGEMNHSSGSPTSNQPSSTGSQNNNNTQSSSSNNPQYESPSIFQQQQLAAFMGKKIGIHSFELLKVIGEGSFSKVCLVRKKDTRQIYALKVLDKGEIKRRNQVEHTITEKRVLSNHRHPFIIKMYHSFQAEDKLYMCLQFIPGGELFGHLRRVHRFPLELAKFYLCEVVLAIEYLHNNNIIYRDLKPENILLHSDGHIKLTDFGLAKEGITSAGGNASGTKTRTFCGTPDYLSPEIIKGLPHGKAVDYWSMGVLLFEFLTGRSPFRGSNRKELYEQIIHTHPIYPKEITESTTKTILVYDDPIKGVKYSQPVERSVVVDLLDRLLVKKPEERLGANGIHEIKSHAFFEDVDWDLMLQKQIPPPFKPPLSDNPNENLQKILGSNINENGTLASDNLLNAKEQGMIMPKAPFKASQSPSFTGFSYDEEGYLASTLENSQTQNTNLDI
ncbi:hypothetical protein C9374_012527 [Naegleria lovaniensis]|uniref:Uncharacterized protein n=1 Tax=Naegleria lovaniensis TaxID=51637 RepID=A0AA88KW27_NAELO|nr:uncharacterized protein C9374_012527 [Naegleria lovaniensis]KAG2392275.1 hypothetical protein C9374_012527 [Naegleria lovaniensis]